MEEKSSNQQIDTNQPKVLRGLVLRGVKEIPTIQCRSKDKDGNEKIVTINEEDYDKSVHGEKTDKLPVKKKVAKKKADKKED